MSFWSPGMKLEYLEKMAIEEALKFYRGNKTQTAAALGIAIRTLDAKLEIYENERIENERRQEQFRKEREAFIARSKGNAPAIEFVHSPNQGPAQRFHVEPTAQISTEQTLPMQERQEVQKVLPSTTPGHRQRRSREAV